MNWRLSDVHKVRANGSSIIEWTQAKDPNADFTRTYFPTCVSKCDAWYFLCFISYSNHFNLFHLVNIKSTFSSLQYVQMYGWISNFKVVTRYGLGFGQTKLLIHGWLIKLVWFGCSSQRTRTKSKPNRAHS